MAAKANKDVTLYFPSADDVWLLPRKWSVAFAPEDKHHQQMPPYFLLSFSFYVRADVIGYGRPL